MDIEETEDDAQSRIQSHPMLERVKKAVKTLPKVEMGIRKSQLDAKDSASEENEEEDGDWEEAEEAEEEEAEESCAKSKSQDKFATVLREFSPKQECKDYVRSHEFKWVFARTVNAYMNSGQTGGVYSACRALRNWPPDI
ncbi:hypothetical protein CYMTET_40139 [Cymbomonas tetramitiformis]|uniref:Uncharacterized protein n=1 Tax=Cymbomonas tetramitiformis TaxID=36881 RepID=A0AAE0C8P8_9CHLO|nr:hypothetical protein CYMTET_40139 [Cymbomonas tetramitiformis]